MAKTKKKAKVGAIQFVGLFIHLIAFSCWAEVVKQEQTVNYLHTLDSKWQILSDQIGRDPQRVIDETLSILPDLSEPLQKTQAHLILSWAYYALIFADEAIEHAQHGLALIQENEQPWLFHSLSLALANALDIAADATQGITLAQNAIEWAKENKDYNILVESYSTYGLLKLTLGNYDDALEYLLDAYNLSKQYNTTSAPGHIASLIALVYEYRGEDSQTIPFYEESLEHYRDVDDRVALSSSLYGLGRALCRLGETERCIVMLEESAKISIELNDRQGLAYTQKELAETHLRLGQLEHAQTLFTLAAETFTLANNPFMQFGAYSGLAEIAIRRSEWSIAESYLRRAETFITGDSMQTHKINVDRKLAEVYAGQQKFNQAYTLLLQSYLTKDVFTREQNNLRLQTLQAQFDLSQKEADNRQLQQQNRLQQQQIEATKLRKGLFSVVTILLALICILFVLLYRKSLTHAKRLEQLANTDELTHLLSRRYTLECINKQIELANRHNTVISLAMVDVDLFKHINDSYGHQIGDQVLSLIGESAQKVFRYTDILGRVGGEEFLFAFPHTLKNEAVVQLKRFQQEVSNIPNILGIDGLNVTVSVGVVEHQHGIDIQALSICADKALYQAKENGRNCIVCGDCP